MTDDVPTRLRRALQGRYTVERELGEGGMATVYLAEDLKHKRKVALKVLRPELAAVVGAERFLAEIETTAGLQHPHILPLFDSGEADGFLYYVMPYVEGESLRDRLDRDDQLPVNEAVRIASDLAEALDHAHRRGVIHRDIKPANILLQDGRPVIADFGIALAVGSVGGARLTETGLSLGTPYYMSPEQAMGDQAVTAASDLYALGCVLYELLAGEPPYTAGTAQAVLARIITGGEVSVRSVRPSVPKNVDAAIRRTLERLPADRFPSAGAFREALLDPGFRYGDDGDAADGRRWGWRGVALGLAAGVLLGLPGGMALSGPGNSGSAAPASMDRPLQLTFSGQARHPAISPDGTFAAFVDVACRQGTFGLCSYDLQVMEVGSTTAVSVVTDAVLMGSPRFTWDGSTVVVPAVLDQRRSGLFAVPRMGGAIRPVAPLGAFDTHPSGDSLLVVPRNDPSRGLVVDLTSGDVVDSITLPPGDAVLDLSWHPSGHLVALRTRPTLTILDRDGRVLDQRTSSGREYIRWTTAGDAILQFRVGPVREDDLMRIAVDENGRFAGAPAVVRAGVPTIYQGQLDVARETGQVVIATGDARNDVWSFRLDEPDGATERRTGGTTWYGNPALSWDGDTAYYLRGDALGDNVYALDLSDGREEALTAERSPGGWTVRFSTDGTRLAYTRSPALGYRLDVIAFPSRRLSSAPLDLRLSSPIPFGDRKLLLSGDAMAVVDSLGAEPRFLDLEDPVIPDVPAVVSPDDRRIAYVAVNPEDVSVLVTVSMDGGETRRLLTLEANELSPGLTWLPDGTLYAGRWRPQDAYPSLWRWSESREQFELITDIQVSCEAVTITIDATGSRGLCQTDESRWDIWAFRGLGR